MARRQPNDTLEIEAGIIKDKSALDILKKTWNSASRKERRLFLEWIEDQEDLAEMEKRLKEPGPTIPWEKVKKDLGI
jgi:hypothetical protein